MADDLAFQLASLSSRRGFRPFARGMATRGVVNDQQRAADQQALGTVADQTGVDLSRPVQVVGDVTQEPQMHWPTPAEIAVQDLNAPSVDPSTLDQYRGSGRPNIVRKDLASGQYIPLPGENGSTATPQSLVNLQRIMDQRQRSLFS